MGRLRTVGILTMLHHLLDVLIHFSTQSYRQGLYASANAKHRNLAIESQASEHQLCRIAFLIDVVKTWRRFFAKPQGIMVAATRQDQSVEMFQGVDDDGAVGYGRDNDRRSTSRYHLLVITITKRSVNILVIGSDANHGLTFRFGKRRVRILEMRLQFKCLHL